MVQMPQKQQKKRSLASKFGGLCSSKMKEERERGERESHENGMRHR